MNKKLLDMLIRRMEAAEKEYTEGGVSHYSQGGGLHIKKGTVIKSGSLISILPHPRFAPTPLHRHNYFGLRQNSRQLAPRMSEIGDNGFPGGRAVVSERLHFS